MSSQPTHSTSRAAYITAMVPFVFLWLLGHGHLAALWLLIPAALCAIQAVRPTRAIWAVVFVLYLAFAGLYGVMLVSDLVVVASGQGNPSVLVDADDSAVFIVLELVLVAMVVWLWKARPASPDAPGPNPFSDPDQL